MRAAVWAVFVCAVCAAQARTVSLETANPDYPEVPNTGATFEHHAAGDTRVIDEDDFGGIAKETYLGKFWWGPDAGGEVHICSEPKPHAPSYGSEQNMHYASLTGMVYRAIHNTYDVTNTPAALPTEFVEEGLGGSNFVFDAYVRLDDNLLSTPTPINYTYILPNEDAKIAVAVQGGKFVVIAGDGVNDRSTRVYETGVKVDTRVMHRVTMEVERTLFSVWVDGKRVPGEFPSRILEGENAGRLRAMGFMGTDVSVDDVFFSRELPFALPGMMFFVR